MVVILRAALLASLLLAGAAMAQIAQEPAPQAGAWTQTKCVRYAALWQEAFARRTDKGLSREFLERHMAFMASGCTAQADVCPRSPEELALANDLVIASMNAGMASTFAPFACRKAM